MSLWKWLTRNVPDDTDPAQAEVDRINTLRSRVEVRRQWEVVKANKKELDDLVVPNHLAWQIDMAIQRRGRT